MRVELFHVRLLFLRYLVGANCDSKFRFVTNWKRDEGPPKHCSLPTAPSAPTNTHNIKMAALGEDLLATVNKLQDLVFNTIGNDSLDLPQIVSFRMSYSIDVNLSLRLD